MKILLKEVTAEIEEKKSRFIAFIRPVKNIEEAESFINEKKKKYWDARHNCSAFILGNDGATTRCNDDGEPSGTAGRPMLEVISHSEIKNIAVVVTRYFGGTLLGTGGLIRAYSDAVKLAIEEAYNNKLIAEEVDGYSLKLKFDYTLLGKVQYYIAEKNINAGETTYEDMVSIEIKFDKTSLDKIKKDFIEISNGKIEFSEPEECTYCLTL